MACLSDGPKTTREIADLFYCTERGRGITDQTRINNCYRYLSRMAKMGLIDRTLDKRVCIWSARS